MSKETGIYEGISNKDYHADTETYSSSFIKKMKVPAEAYYSLHNPSEYKDCYRIGSAIHKLILEPEDFHKEFLIGLNGVRRAGKDNIKEWSLWFSEHGADGDMVTDAPAADWNERFERSTGKNIVTQKEIDEITVMSDVVMANPEAAKLLIDGVAESSVYWTDEETGVKLRCRPDYLSSSISDLKSIKSIDDKTIWNQTKGFGYPLSAEMYKDGVYRVTGEDKDFIFIFINTRPPYFCRTFILGDELSEMGHNMYRSGVRALAECLESDEWPGYPDYIEVMTNPYEDDSVDMTGVEVE